MSRDTKPQPDEGGDGERNWSRRTLLKVGGTGAAIAGIAGINIAESQPEHGGDGDDGGQTEDGEDDDGEDDDGEDHFLSDVIDPTFGYSFAADETGQVDIDTVVEMATEEGDGAHGDFPMDEDGSELPAEFYFDPVGLHVTPGTLVHFFGSAGEHTATAFHEKFASQRRPITTRVPEGVPGFTSPPLVTGESWVYEFSTKGVYDILCLPHLRFGMVMRVVVVDPGTDDLEDEMFDEPAEDAPFDNVNAVLNADELDPENIVESGTVAWEDITLAEGTETGTETETETGTETETETGTETDTPTGTETDTPTGTETDTPTGTETGTTTGTETGTPTGTGTDTPTGTGTPTGTPTETNSGY